MANQQPRVIAECGLCHDGSFSRAIAMIDAAADAGVWGVKFQKRSAPHWFADATPRRPGRNSFGMTEGAHRKALELTASQHETLRRHAHSRGLAFGVSVWDVESASEALHVIGADWIKIGRPMMVMPGGEGRRLLELLASMVTGDKLHVSCRDESETRLVRMVAPDARVYYCPGRYPDNDALVQATLGVAGIKAAGVSLHSRNLHHARDAVAAGARYVEYHFALPGTVHSDAEFALAPQGLARLCEMLEPRREVVA